MKGKKERVNRGESEALEILRKITPILQRVAMGDFGVKVEIPKKNETIIEFLVTLNTMIEDLEYSLTLRKKIESELKTKIKELEEIKEGLEEKVKERTRELEAKVDELEKFNKIAVGREIKMIELKKEIDQLKESTGKRDEGKVY